MSNEINLKQSRFGGENTADSDEIVDRSQRQVNSEVMIRGLLVLKKSLEEEREELVRMICMLGGEEERSVESNREDQLLMVIERMKKDLEDLKKMKLDLEMEVEFLKSQLSSINASD